MQTTEVQPGGTGFFSAQVRGQPKAVRTRARLMDAAMILFARDGFEGASVNEIARLADVANGTFYSHFPDRDAIAQAVALGLAEAIAARMDAAMTDVTDAAERVALGTRSFIDYASRRAAFGYTLFRASFAFPELRQGVNRYVESDIARGVAQGLFHTRQDEMLVIAVGAVTLAGLNARLEGAGPEAGCRAAELQLLMLGADAEVARAAAWRTVEALPIDID